MPDTPVRDTPIGDAGERAPLAVTLGQAIVDARSRGVPASARQKVRDCLIDFLGCAFEASPLPWSRRAAALAEAEGPCSIVGSPRGTALMDAAFANAVAGHGLVREDMHAGAVAHLGVVVLPALLVVVYAVPLDLGGVGRLAQLAVPWGILLIVVLFLLAAPWYAMDNLMPLLPTANVAWGSYQVFSFLSEVVFALYLASLSSRRAEAARALVGAPLVNGLLVLLLTAMPILLYGPTPAAMMNAPGMSAIRAIHYGFVVERLDTFVQPVWVIFVILKLLLWTMLGARLLAAALGIRWWAQIGRVATVVAAVLSLELYHLVAVERSVGTLWYRLGAPLLLVVLVACAILFRPRRSLAPA
jgi:hypothetical protein